MSHWVVCASLLLKEYDDVSKVDTNQLLLSAAIAQKKDRSRFGLKVGAVRAIHRPSRKPPGAQPRPRPAAPKIAVYCPQSAF